MKDDLELGKEESRIPVRAIGSQARDGGDTVTTRVAVRVKGDVQKMGSMGLDDQLDDVRQGKRVCTLSSAISCWIMVRATEFRDTISGAGWVKMVISVWDPLNWSFYRHSSGNVLLDIRVWYVGKFQVDEEPST